MWRGVLRRGWGEGNTNGSRGMGGGGGDYEGTGRDGKGEISAAR